MTAETMPSASILDSVWMRLLAALIAICGALLWVWANQDFLAERLSGRSSGAMTPYQQCLEARMASVEELAKAAGYTTKQKELAEIRAREYCGNQTGM